MPFSVNCSGLALVFAAAMVLVLPINWILSFFLAALFHELCHYFAIRLTKGHVCGIIITHNGVIMQAASLSAMQELFCALAGPAGSFLLFSCYRWVPRIALCAGVQGLFNLLPVYPLDGGRSFRILMECWFPRQAEGICRWTEYLLIFVVFALGLWLCAGVGLGLAPIFLSLLLLSRMLSGKIPCKQGKVRVQ